MRFPRCRRFFPKPKPKSYDTVVINVSVRFDHIMTHNGSFHTFHERSWVRGVVRRLLVAADEGARVVGAHNVVQTEAHGRLAASGKKSRRWGAVCKRGTQGKRSTKRERERERDSERRGSDEAATNKPSYTHLYELLSTAKTI